jgi:nucleotide-binding universal stress UspA family protein
MPTTAPYATLLVPTDLGAGATPAFATALRIAMSSRAEVVVVHVDANAAHADWQRVASARDLLVRWGLVAQSADAAAYEAAGARVRLVARAATDAVGVVVDEAQRANPDLLVLSTQARAGLDRWFAGSVAEAISREAARPALFLPQGRKGIVDEATGEVRLGHVLLPLPPQEKVDRALVALQALASALGVHRLHVTLLHVGGEADVDPPDLAPYATWSFATRFETGGVVEQIVSEAERHPTDLILMPTHGRDSLGDLLRGSVTERVLRGAPCPVLAIPL